MAVEKFGNNQQVFFYPMADGNKGGFRLSLDDKVLNPILWSCYVNLRRSN